MNTNIKIIAGIAAAAVLIPSGIALNGVRGRRVEAQAFRDQCDARAESVLGLVEASDAANLEFIKNAERVLASSGGFELMPLVSGFLSARDRMEIAEERYVEAYYGGGDESFFRQCDAGRYGVKANGDPNWDEPIDHLVSASDIVEAASQAAGDVFDSEERAEDLQTAINNRF